MYYLVYTTGDALDLHEVTVNGDVRVFHAFVVQSGDLQQEIDRVSILGRSRFVLELPPAGVHPSLPIFPTKKKHQITCKILDKQHRLSYDLIQEGHNENDSGQFN
jgi:hypothetical protein